MVEVEVLIGMIASGKSTWAKARAKEGWIIINDDSIVCGVHANQYTLYQKSLKPLYKSIEDHILHTSIAMGKNVVIDRGVDISASSRKRWIVIAKSLDVTVRGVWFDVFGPEVHAKRRALSDSRGHSYDYWLKVANAHAARYDQPSLEEGFDQVVTKKWED